MANQNRPMGARLNGDALRIGKYVANATIYPGDIVIAPDSNGQVGPSAGGAAEKIVGVALSKAASGGDVLVADHPSQEYLMQVDTAAVADQTAIGQFARVLSTAGDSTYNISRHQVSGATVATTNTLPLKIVRLSDEVNNAFGSKCDVVIVANTRWLA